MRLSSVALTATLIMVAQGCYDDSYKFRRDAGGASWGYTGFEGPLNWATLNKVNNTKCSEGKFQTPINLDSSIKKEPGAGYAMKLLDGTAPTFENKGHTIEVRGLGNATLTFDGKVYNLLQFHFHATSEHRIEEEIFLLEIHFVHKASGMYIHSSEPTLMAANQQKMEPLQLWDLLLMIAAMTLTPSSNPSSRTWTR